MIFKVQLPIAGHAKREGLALVYNENREIFFEVPIDAAIQEAMDGEMKRFFEGHLESNDDGTKQFHIDADAEWQDW